MEHPCRCQVSIPALMLLKYADEELQTPLHPPEQNLKVSVSQLAADCYKLSWGRTGVTLLMPSYEGGGGGVTFQLYAWSQATYVAANTCNSLTWEHFPFHEN